VRDQPIDLWIIHLGSPALPVSKYLALLSDSEKTRMGQFHFDEDKWRYAAVHAGLRKILAGYLSIDPETIQFILNSYAKPALVDDQNPQQLQFNLSHSNGLALIAVSTIQPVGVDVERIKHLTNHLKLAERHFSPDEIDVLKQKDRSVSSAAFIQLWAGKEAFIKARGNGMSLPLNQFSLAKLISDPESPSCVVPDPGDGRHWWVSRLHLFDGYLGAVAVQGESGTINYLSGRTDLFV
jgi:4'-phosphopantetheinyl transferase